jgi:hypothetical protein
VVRRRRRLVGEANTEVVTYTLDPRFVEFEVWDAADHLPLGAQVEREVQPRLFNGVITYHLPREGEDF